MQFYIDLYNFSKDIQLATAETVICKFGVICFPEDKKYELLIGQCETIGCLLQNCHRIDTFYEICEKSLKVEFYGKYLALSGRALLWPAIVCLGLP